MAENETNVVIFVHMWRARTETKLTIPIPPEVSPEEIVDWTEKELGGQFMPIKAEVVPVESVNDLYFTMPWGDIGIDNA